MDGTIVRCNWCDSLAEIKERLPFPCPSCGHTLGLTKAACRCHQCVVRPAKPLNQSKSDKTPGQYMSLPPVSCRGGHSFLLRLPDGHLAELWLSDPNRDSAAALARVLALAPDLYEACVAALPHVPDVQKTTREMLIEVIADVEGGK